MCMAVLGLSMVDVELLLEIHRWHIKSAKVYYLFSIKICNNVFCIKRGTLTSMGTLLTGYLLYLVTLVAYFIQCFIVTIGTLRKCTMCIYGVMLFVYSEYTSNGFEKKTKLALTRDTYRALSITGQNESKRPIPTPLPYTAFIHHTAGSYRGYIVYPSRIHC